MFKTIHLLDVKLERALFSSKLTVCFKRSCVCHSNNPKSLYSKYCHWCIFTIPYIQVCALMIPSTSHSLTAIYLDSTISFFLFFSFVSNSLFHVHITENIEDYTVPVSCNCEDVSTSLHTCMYLTIWLKHTAVNVVMFLAWLLEQSICLHY